MAYTKQTWHDLPSKDTPINASRLGHIEDGIYAAASVADSATTALDGKVDKVTGKGLSENDFTNALKTKLDGIESGAEANVQSDWSEADSSADDFIKNKPTLGTASAKNSTNEVDAGITDLVESGAVYDAIETAYENLDGKISAQQQLLEDTVGWTGKNLYTCEIETTTYRGITYTVNADGSINVDGTASDNANSSVILQSNLKDLMKQGEYYTVDCDNPNFASSDISCMLISVLEETTTIISFFDGSKIKIPDNVYSSGASLKLQVWVRKGITVDNQLLRPTITHVSVNEYCASKELLEDTVLNTVGYINDNIIPLGTITKSGDTSISAVQKSDGSIVINGTPNETTFIGYGFNVGKGEYKLSGCPSGGSSSAYLLQMRVSSLTGTSLGTDSGDGAVISNSESRTLYVSIRIASGYVCNNLTIKPSLISTSTVETIISSNIENGATASKAYAVGEHFMRNGKFATVTASISSGDTLTEETNYKIVSVASYLDVENAQFTTRTISGITFTANLIERYGKVVNFKLNFTAANDITLESTVFAVTPFNPFTSNLVFFAFDTTLRTILSNVFTISSIGNLVFKGEIPAGSYSVTGTYICQ